MGAIRIFPQNSSTEVPESVSNYQARHLLIQQGLFTEVDDQLKNADQTVVNNQISLQAWEYANDFYRNSVFVESLGSLLNLTDDQIDQMFISASKII